jgi:potassium channel
MQATMDQKIYFLVRKFDGNVMDATWQLSGDYDGRTTLHIAVVEGQLEVVRLLLEKGAKVDVLDRWGSSPLSEALSNNKLSIAELLLFKGAKLQANSFCMVQEAAEAQSGKLSLLCQVAGVSPDSHDYDQRSTLHTFCAAGNLKAVENLIAVGADVNFVDRYASFF